MCPGFGGVRTQPGSGPEDPLLTGRGRVLPTWSSRGVLGPTHPREEVVET